LWLELIVLAQVPIAIPPAKGALHLPTLRDRDKALHLLRT
jgi:hypothetical protein